MFTRLIIQVINNPYRISRGRTMQNLQVYRNLYYLRTYWI